ncbi:MAG: hypothetical protein ACRYG8_10305 [Janthinobacterium lividum]
MRILIGADLRTAAVQLMSEGLRPSEIAELLGHCDGTIRATLSRARAAGADVPLGRPGYLQGAPVPRSVQAEIRSRRVAAMSVAGLTPREIAVRLGTTPATVSATLSRLRSRGVAVPVGCAGRPRAA